MSPHRAAPGKRAFLVLLLLPALVPALARPGQAQVAAPAAKMRELNSQAIADYAVEDYESAQLGLREAIAMGQRSGLGSDPLMARLLVNLGAVYINGLKDARRGTRALESALAVDPGVQLTDTLATPELRELFSGLQARTSKPDSGSVPANPDTGPTPTKAEPAGAAAPEPLNRPPATAPRATAAVAPPAPSPRRSGGNEEPDLPARVPQPLYCPTPDEAPPSAKITLNCVLQPDVTASKVLLHYRAPGETQFRTASTVKSTKGWYRGVIPSDVVQGGSLHFYVEALDAGNEVVGTAGRDDSPNVVLIREGAPPVPTGLFAGVRFRPRAGAGLTAGSIDEDPLEEVARDRERERDSVGLRRRRDGAVYVGLGIGSGYGYHGTQRLEFYGDAIIEKGWIPSGLLHLAPEVGYQLSPHFAISVLARLQIISQSGSGDMRVGNPARSAFAVLARPQMLLGERNLQANLSGYLGAGDGFRLTLPPQLPRYRRNDSVRGGPLVFGVGAGLLYHLSTHIAAAIDARWLVGFSELATVADLGLGLQFGF